MDKVEYEEWALKAVDPAVSPKPWKLLSEGSSSDSGAAAKKEPVKILYPKSILEPTALLETLKAQLAHRGPHHKSWMIRCLVYATAFPPPTPA